MVLKDDKRVLQNTLEGLGKNLIIPSSNSPVQ